MNLNSVMMNVSLHSLCAFNVCHMYKKNEVPEIFLNFEVSLSVYKGL